MTTPSRTPSRAEMYPTEPHSGQRISLSLSDLVSPGLKEFDDLETETKTSVSGNDATNYKKELKKLLAKSRGTAYEATLRRFVEQKYNEIKKDEASNRKLFGHSRGAIAANTPSIASLSHSKYDATAGPAAAKESSIYGVSSTYQDGRIVETNFDTLGSRQGSPRSSKVPPPPPSQQSGRVSFSHGASLGYSILNESVNLGVTYNNKSRIDEISKPVERNVYKGPTPVSPFGSTNHLGRQRPPPPPPTRGMSRSPGRRAPSASPYASPYRQRKAAEQAAAAEAEAGASYSDLFQSLAHTAEILPQSGAKSYDEFRQWLGNNRDWQKKRTNKVQSKQQEVMKDTTHDFKPQIIPKSRKLAEAANKRAFQKLAASGDHTHAFAHTGDNVSVDGLSENGLAFVLGNATKVSLHRKHSRSRSRSRSHSPRQSRSRSRSPVSPQMRSFAPTPLPYPEVEVKPVKVRGDSLASTDTSHSALSKQRLSTSSVVSQATHASTGPLHKPRAGSAQHGRSKMEADELSVASAPVHATHAQPHAHTVGANVSSSRSVVPPSDVFERLAVRGRLQAHKTYNWDLPPPQDAYAPRISERSVRLAEKKHHRDLQVGSRARAASADGTARHTNINLNHMPLHQDNDADPQYLERNYDYYELYTMPERYMYRVAHPEQYKVSGTVPRNNIRNADEKVLVEVSGLSKVTRARQERAMRSASPAQRSVAGSLSMSTSTGAGAGRAAGQASAHSSRANTQQNTQQNSRQNTQQNTPAGSILRTTSTDGAMHMHELGGLNISTAFELSSPQPNVLHSVLPVHTDDGGKYYTHESGSPRGGRNVSRSPKPRAHSPPYSPGGHDRDDRSVEQSRHVHQAVKEGIQQSKAMSRSKREAEMQEFNRRHYLSKETKEPKPFQPLLLATETHRIMSRINSSFEDRTNKSVETLYVRREVAKKFPSPGPGRYTNGIAVDKIVQSLSVGSPNKLSRSRSMSPAPGHRGFSFSKEPLGRFVDPAADPATAPFSPGATGGISMGATGGSHR